MSSSLRLLVPRPMLIRIFALLLVVLGPLGTARLHAFVDLAFIAELELVETSLTNQGVTAANATSFQWQQAFAFAEAVLGRQPGALRLKFFLALNPLGAQQIRGFVSAISAFRANEVTMVGKGDFRGPAPNLAQHALWRAAFEAAGATQTLKSTPVEITLNYPTAATNKFLNGISYDGYLAYGDYEQPSAPVTSQPFTINLREPSPSVIVLPLPTGHTGATVVAGSTTGNALVGDTTQGTGGNQVITPSVWTRMGNDPYSVRSLGNFPGSTRTQARGISGDGTTIVGSYTDAQFRTRAHRWTQASGTFLDLGLLPGQTSARANAASENGARIVGTSGTGAFSWRQAGGMTALPNLPGLNRAEALCISPDESFIGGMGLDASFRETAQLWAKKGDTYVTYDLGKILGGSGANLTGWTLNKITAIVKNADQSYNFAGDATLNGVPQGYFFQLTAGAGVGPAITTQPRAQAVGIGGTAVFSVAATNATGYQWQRNGVAIPGATGATYTLPNAQSANTGDYTCVVSGAEGVTVSAVAQLTVANTVSRLNNLSVRATAGTGANTLIVGLTTAGGTKDVLLRGVGPTLSQFGVVGALADPQLALFNSSSVETARNDDWGGSAALTASFNIAGAFPLALTSKDAAILTTLTPGSYSAQVTGTAGTTGVVLMESYDSDIGSPLARYTNLSARNQVGTGANILIVGFNLTGSGSKRLLIRAVGPALAQFGVAGVLSDPQAVVFNAAGTEVGRNDDWENTTANQGQSTLIGQASSSVGAFPLPGASRDSAMVVTLEPGSYTVQVSGVNNGTGVALVEIYELP